MSELTYEFVKGKGWVASPSDLITMGCGTVVRLEFRLPKEGEKFDCSQFFNFYKDRLWRSHITSTRYEKLSLRYEHYTKHFSDPRYSWCVFVPV